VRDALVIGAGVVGAACAWQLAAAGMRVRVVDAGRAGGGATAAGMGHILLLDDSPAQFALTRYSQELLDELAGELPARVELNRCGTLWLAEDEEQLELARAKHARLREMGVASAVLDSAELTAEEPKLRPGLAGALLVPGDSVLYPPALAHWLLNAAVAAGARVDEGMAVTAVEAGALAACAVVAGGERIEAGVVVNAAGAAAAVLTPGLPVVPRKGHLVVTDRYPGICRRQLSELGYLRSAHTMDRESFAFVAQPRPGGQFVIGSTRELVGWDASVNRDLVARMLARAVWFLPALARLSVIRTWTGMRPATPDKLPLIGRWPELDGVWLAAGHEGLGITTALGTGRLLADLVTGRVPAIDPAPFAPARVLQEA
jgi:D-hydroxyproline dehydrogenase subunit beta